MRHLVLGFDRGQISDDALDDADKSLQDLIAGSRYTSRNETLVVQCAMETVLQRILSTTYKMHVPSKSIIYNLAAAQAFDSNPKLC